MSPRLGLALVLTAVSLLASARPAPGQERPQAVPQPVQVPAETPEPARGELLRRRSGLFEQRDALRGRVAAHNSKCRSVPEKSTAAAECAAAQGPLSQAVAAYAAAVRDFNAAVAATRAVAGPRRAFVALSLDEEMQLGRAITSELDQTGRIVTDPAVTGYVGGLIARLAPPRTLEIPITLRVVRDPEVNAFAMPGGVVVVNTGLIAGLKSESELAAVLAHELAHVSRRHPLEATDTLAQAVGIGLALSGPLHALGAPIVKEALAYKFGRDQEREADRIAVETLYRAGITPGGIVRVFDRWRRTEGTPGLRDRLFSTHPTSDERVRNVEPLLADPRFNALREPDPAAFRALQRQVGP